MTFWEGTPQGKREKYVLYLMLAPCLVVLFCVTIVPVVYLLRLSAFRWELAKPHKIGFVGLANYLKLIQDVNFWHAFRVTVILLGQAIGIQMLLALFIAELLSSAFRGKEAVRTLLLFPMVVPPIVAGIIWRILYHPTAGLVNYFLSFVRLDHPWLSDPDTALFAIIVADTWEWTPFIILMFLAAYAAIPRHLVEVADVDGASRWKRFLHITLPLIKPMIFVAFIFRVIEIIRIFPKIYLLTGGGPGRTTETLYFYTYRSGFMYGNIGYSSALGVFTLFLTLVVLGGVMRKA